MSSERTTDDCIAAYEQHYGQLKRTGGEHKGPCPVCGGDDRFHIASGRTGVLLLHCRHGCSFLDIVKALFPDDDRPQQTEREPDPEPEDYGCTLAQIAERTKLPIDFLASLDWEDSQCYVEQAGSNVPSVRIPYLGIDGRPTCVKHRVRLSGKDKYRFQAGSGARVYGETELGSVVQSRKLLIVEGETCAATLWHHELPALGVPGVGATRVLEAWHFNDVDRVYVVADKDEAGEKFLIRVQERLRELGLTQPVLVMRLEEKDTNALYQADPARFRQRFLEAHRLARGLRKSKIPAEAFQTMRQIMRASYPDTEWVVRGVLPVGLAVLASAPKAGKSSLAYQIAAGVSQGAYIAERWRGDEGEVLYLDLEQKIGRQTQARGEVVGAGCDMDRWTVVDDWPRFDAGGLEELDVWLEEHPACRLVVLDVISRLMPINLKGNIYHAEYDIFSRVKRLGDDRQVCILALHHDNKTKSEDMLNAISGSRAITGASNAILWLTRTAGCLQGELAVMGRDIVDADLTGAFQHRLWDFSEEDNDEQ